MMISFLTVFLFQGKKKKKKKKKSKIVRLKSKVVERSPMSWVVDDANSSNVFLPLGLQVNLLLTKCQKT